MKAQRKRRLPALRRVVTYLSPEEYAWVASAALGQRTSVSSFVAGVLFEAWLEEQTAIREMDEEQAVAEGRR